jgi:CheY-like chemotaxis protein
MLPSTTEKNDTAAARTRCVLYVDDMRELREVAQLALASSGHHVDCVADGTEALDRIAARADAYDLVISDHHMAGLNGIGLVIKLREIGYPGRIAIVSSELNREVADEYRQLGVSKILYKPVELADLRALVAED